MIGKYNAFNILVVSLLILYQGPYRQSYLDFGKSDIQIEEQKHVDYVDWIINTPVKGDKFPIAIYPIMDLDIYIETSWGMNYNEYIAQNDTQGRYTYNVQFIWIELPATSNGNGKINVSVNYEFQKTYSISWEKVSFEDELPLVITYSFRWFSYWYGETQLNIELRNDGILKVEYYILYRRDAGRILKPYNNNFSFELVNGISLGSFYNDINTTNIDSWETWTYLAWGGLDGEAFEENAIIYWDEDRMTNVTHWFDDGYDGKGRSTINNNQNINPMLTTIKSYVIDLIDQNNLDLETSETKSENNQFTENNPSVVDIKHDNSITNTANYLSFELVTILSILISIPIIKRKYH